MSPDPVQESAKLIIFMNQEEHTEQFGCTYILQNSMGYSCEMAL